MKSRNTMKKWVIGQALLLALGIAVGSIGSAQATHKGFEHGNGGNNNNGPQLGVDVAVYCGNPGEELFDMDGSPIHTFSPGMNVVVFLSDASDDNNTDEASVGKLGIQCLEKTGKGKKGYDQGDYLGIPAPALDMHERQCVIDTDNAIEWKATVTASGGNIRKDVSDTCEEVVL